MIRPGFYPPTPQQRLRAWYRRQQAPSLASVDKSVDVVRPRLTAIGAGIVAFLAILAALAYGIHTSAAMGWHDLEGAGWFAFCGVSIVAALLLKLYALRAGYR